jgi:hypothetical protein
MPPKSLFVRTESQLAELLKLMHTKKPKQQKLLGLAFMVYGLAEIIIG